MAMSPFTTRSVSVQPMDVATHGSGNRGTGTCFPASLVSSYSVQTSEREKRQSQSALLSLHSASRLIAVCCSESWKTSCGAT
ncbi:hypothetical protein PBY51_016215 [Eleginops maclovinus]|uniref:Uncharacterized protein n=1 Tax=Eleginops maclovinus TaxID=56733 RepID=A0AAN8AQN2_ELEMC|nr:hypothetical protein PBY51_016215 [Eleginops maclovinus]